MKKQHFTPLRPAFSMLTAIAVMLIMGLLSGYILNTSAGTGEETFAQYHKEQAVLLSEAYTEAAILNILNTDMAAVGAACVQNMQADITTLDQGGVAGVAADVANLGRGYHVDVRIRYITNTINNPRPTNITTGNCAGGILNLDAGGNIINYNHSFVPVAGATIAHLAAVIDVYVRYKNVAYPNPANAPWVTYHRRTLQKI